MPIPIVCPNCSAKMNAPDAAAGKRVKCPKCQSIVPVPLPFEEVAAAHEIEEATDKPPPKKAPSPSAPVDNEDQKLKPRIKAAANDDEDDYRPSKKKAKKRDDDDEGGVSMTRNIIMSVVLVILIGVAIYIFWKRSQDANSSQSVTERLTAAVDVLPGRPA